MAEVVGLDGRAARVVDGRVADGGVVARLGRLLAEAERGEIRGFAIAVVRPDLHTSTLYEVPEGDPISHELMAAICYLQWRYAAHKVGQADEISEGPAA